MNLDDLRRRAALLASAKRIPYEQAILEMAGLSATRRPERSQLRVIKGAKDSKANDLHAETSREGEEDREDPT